MATGSLIGIVAAVSVGILLLILGVAYLINRNRKKANLSMPFHSESTSSVGIKNPLYDARAHDQNTHASGNYAEPTVNSGDLYSELNYSSIGKGNYAEPTYAGVEPQYALAINDTDSHEYALANNDAGALKKGDPVYSVSSKHSSYVLNEEDAMA